jgi:hypothetical protein
MWHSKGFLDHLSDLETCLLVLRKLIRFTSSAAWSLSISEADAKAASRALAVILRSDFMRRSRRHSSPPRQTSS